MRDWKQYVKLPEIPSEKGYAWFFEKGVAFGPPQDILSLTRGRGRHKLGAFIGVVKGKVPTDPSRVMWIRYRQTAAYKRRKFLSKLGVSRSERKKLQPLKRWLK